MSEIFGSTTTTPINPNAFSGGGSGAELDATELCNAFKQTVSSKANNAVELKDMSPLKHKLKVQLSSDTVTDFSGVNVISFYSEIADFLKAGDVYTSAVGGCTAAMQTDGALHINGTLRKLDASLQPIIDLIIIPVSTVIPLDHSNNATLQLSFDKKVNTKASISYRVVIKDKNNRAIDTLFLSETNNVLNLNEYSNAAYIEIALQCGNPTNTDVSLDCTITPYWEIRYNSVSANADGTVDNLYSCKMPLCLRCDNPDVAIQCEYNKDIHKLSFGGGGITEEDLEEALGNLNIPEVSDIYEADSSKAQSGKAVSSAIKQAVDAIEIPDSVCNDMVKGSPGLAVELTDVSPVKHKLQIQLKNDSTTDFSEVKLISSGELLTVTPYVDADKKVNSTYAHASAQVQEDDSIKFSRSLIAVQGELATPGLYDKLIYNIYEGEPLIVNGKAQFGLSNVTIDTGSFLGECLTLHAELIDNSGVAVANLQSSYPDLLIINADDYTDVATWKLYLKCTNFNNTADYSIAGSVKPRVSLHYGIYDVNTDGTVDNVYSAASYMYLYCPDYITAIECAYNKDLSILMDKMDKFGNVSVQHEQELVQVSISPSLKNFKLRNHRGGITLQAIATEFSVNDDKAVFKDLAGEPLIVEGVATPNADSPTHQAVNKEYVDGAIGSIDTVLDSIIAIQNSLIGGGSV